MSQCKCTKELYKAFLQSISVRYSGLALSEVSPTELSHDSISRWLRSKSFRPREVWEISQNYIDKKSPCLLIADDTVLTKTHSKKIDLVNYQYSGNQHDVIAGIGLINLLWYGLEEESSVPIDYRIYDKNTDGKTKNNHFCDMLSLAKARGLTPEAVVIDSWYASLKNLKAIRDHGWEWITSLRKNRKVNRNDSLENLIIPEEGLRVHLRGYGWVTVYKFVAKNGRIDYITTNRETPKREQIKRAKICGISQQSIHYIIKSNLSNSKLAPQIASALNINSDWLIYGMGKPDLLNISNLPILHSVHMLKKFLQNNIEIASLDLTIIDTYLGDNPFAYLFKPKCLFVPTTCIK